MNLTLLKKVKNLENNINKIQLNLKEIIFI